MSQSSNWMTRGDYLQNAKKVSDFYQQVLKSFIILLERECRYKGFISQQQLEDMEKLVNQKLKNPQTFIVKCVSMKEGSYKTQVEIKNEPQPQREYPELKEQHFDDKDEYLFGDDFKKNQKGKQSDKQDDLDDLQLFHGYGLANQQMNNLLFKSMKSQVEVKKQDHSQEYIQNKPAASQQQIKNEQQSQKQDDAEDITVEQCLQNLGSIILATFSAQTLRHKPKQQKITVTLDNSFLKTPHNEVFVGSVPIEIVKVQKSDIKKQFSNHSKNKYSR